MELDQVSQELMRGYHRSARLIELLERPLDGRGQDEAVVVAREVLRVFAASLFMLKPDNSAVLKAKTSSMVKRADDSIVLSARTNDKRLSKDEAARMEIVTASPHADGHQWRKYGQKKINNSNFQRNYYRCIYSRDRRCPAKKRVQQQRQQHINSPAMFQVYYVNDHTCHAAFNSTALTSTTHAPEVLDSTKDGSDLLRHIGWAQENEAIVSCLANVINGPAGPSTSSLAADVAGVPTSLDDVTMEVSFPYDQLISPAGGGDVSMDILRFMDTTWTQHS